MKRQYLIQLSVITLFLISLAFPYYSLAATPSKTFRARIIAVGKEARSTQGKVRKLKVSPVSTSKAKSKAIVVTLCTGKYRTYVRSKISPRSLILSSGLIVTLKTTKKNKLTLVNKLTYLKPPDSNTETPPTPSPTPTPIPTIIPESKKIALPIEVLGGAGTTEIVKIALSTTQASQGKSLYLLTHGLQYDDKVLVTINYAHSIPLNNASVTILGNAKNFGGIGGGFHTIPMALSLPSGLLKVGDNIIEFAYTKKSSYQVSGFKLLENRIDDASSGFRILKFNLRDNKGESLLLEDIFHDDDPTKWSAPEGFSNLQKAIAEGEMLWRGKKPNGAPYKLLNHSDIGLTPLEMKATCSDCHAHDGRDLKYYNYSNRSIIERSKIHGLTEDEGKRIAAFIRTLPNTPLVPHARPWNPPFQPGPGLDSKPAYEWAAGAGLEAVLEDPAELYDYLFPGSFSINSEGKRVWNVAKITPDPLRMAANISMREAPIAMQLMDWNQWLPKVHPMDSYEDLLATNEDFKSNYEFFQKNYGGTDNTNSLRALGATKNYPLFAKVSINLYNSIMFARNSYPFDPMNHSLKEAQRRYALPLIALVKLWETYMEFDLSDKIAPASCGSRADARSWRMGNLPFNTSPLMAGLKNTNETGSPDEESRDGHAIGHNTSINFRYFSATWYHLQLILDHGNRNPLCGVSAGAPFDWGYVMGVLKDLQGTNMSGVSTLPLMYLYTAKGLQIFDTGLGVDKSNSGGGWNPVAVSPLPLQEFSYGGVLPISMTWKNVPSEARAKLMESLFRAWLDANKASTPQQYYTPTIPFNPNFYLAYQSPDSKIMTHGENNFANQVYKMATWKVGSLDFSTRGFGVSRSLHNELMDWAQTIWPRQGDGTPAPWMSLKQ